MITKIDLWKLYKSHDHMRYFNDIHKPLIVFLFIHVDITK